MPERHRKHYKKGHGAHRMHTDATLLSIQLKASDDMLVAQQRRADMPPP